MNEDKRNRIDELTARLNEASKAYYDDAAEIMTNYEYDEMYDELLALEAETGYIRPDSPSINVGYETGTALPKVVHETKMLSLNKTKDRGELRAWLGEHEGVLSWKLDGLTVVLTYDGGRLVQAVTRGNGTQGELITANALACRNVPASIPFTGRAVVRGEAVIRYSDFNKINEAIDDANSRYKNPRNLCSGSIRQLDPSVTASRNVYFYAFTLARAGASAGIGRESTVDASGEAAAGAVPDFGGRLSGQMEWMKEQGFDVVPYRLVDQENLIETIDLYESEISGFDIPSDGLVLAYEDLAYAGTLGNTAKFPRHSMAFKWRDQQADTVLRAIEWSPSRTGLLNPVALFDPVELEGTTVSRASVHNLSIIDDLKLGIGDTIRVYKANMIIPQISANLTMSGGLEIPDTCPVCGGRTAVVDADASDGGSGNGTRTLICLNPDCLAKHVKKFSHFVSRDALNIEGLSESGLLKLIGAGAVREYADLFRLGDHRDEIIGMEGFGAKSCDNLIASAERASHTTPARLLYGLGVPGIGVATSGLIARACRNKWAGIEALDEEGLTDIVGIGSVMAADYVKYFEDDNNRQEISALMSVLSLDETFEETGTGLTGKTFVITGSLEHYSSRKELKAEIEAEGGRVAGSVSAKTDYLITNDPGSGSAKNRAAKENGVAIITEDEVRAMLGHGAAGE